MYGYLSAQISIHSNDKVQNRSFKEKETSVSPKSDAIQRASEQAEFTSSQSSTDNALSQECSVLKVPTSSPDVIDCDTVHVQEGNSLQCCDTVQDV